MERRVSRLFFCSIQIISSKNISKTFDGKEWEYMESYFLVIKLPNDTRMTTQVGSDSVLEEILKVVVKKKSFLLQKNEIAAEKFTLELPGESLAAPIFARSRNSSMPNFLLSFLSLLLYSFSPFQLLKRVILVSKWKWTGP